MVLGGVQGVVSNGVKGIIGSIGPLGGNMVESITKVFGRLLG